MLDASLPPDPDLRALALLLPQFHPTPENDAFWGPGFTEWTNIARARPRYRGHDQPRLPGALGFYDLRLAETRHAQAAMARKAGLSGFAWYHYWFAGRRVLHQPFDRTLADQSCDFPFCLVWANENWTRAWDGGDREVLIAQDYCDADTRAHARHLVPALSDPRAICVGTRPVFVVYAPEALPDAARWSDIFRETLAPHGIDPFLVRAERQFDRDLRPPSATGFDAGLDVQPFSRAFADWQRTRPELPRDPASRALRRLKAEIARRSGPRDRHHDLPSYVDFLASRPAASRTRLPMVCPSWDNSPRRPHGRAILFRGATPDLFARWTARAAAEARATGAPFLFVNAWNEWAEGAHLEPCRTHGDAWLDAFARGFLRPDALRPSHGRARSRPCIEPS